jgi:hypothetical protein
MGTSVHTPGCFGYRVRGPSGPLFFCPRGFIAKCPAGAGTRNFLTVVMQSVVTAFGGGNGDPDQLRASAQQQEPTR